ncbi:MAG: hypothetical protein RMK49_15720 [Abditibacteriales bacterium]|nr:hypothetical protein [Abditibacteriales bacterium]
MNGIDDDGDGAVDEDPVDYQPLRGVGGGDSQSVVRGTRRV